MLLISSAIITRRAIRGAGPVPTSLFFRILIALTALGLFVSRVWWPRLQIDMPALAIAIIVLTVLGLSNNASIAELVTTVAMT